MELQADGPTSVVELGATPALAMGREEFLIWAGMPKAERDEAFRTKPQMKEKWKVSVKWYHSLLKSSPSAPKSPAAVPVALNPTSPVTEKPPAITAPRCSTPRVSAELKKPSTPLEPPARCPTPVPARNSARQFYDMPELRSRVLSLLGRRDLASFMRVERHGMHAVACELYRTVSYEHLVERMSRVTASGAMYYSAVSHVLVNNMTLTSKLRRALDIRGHGQPAYTCWLEKYHIELLNHVVPRVRELCSRIRSIRFGQSYEPFGSRSWTVHFHPPPSHPPRDSPTSNHTTSCQWHIEHFRSYVRKDFSDPIKRVPAPLAPSSKYASLARFDLRLRELADGTFEAWLHALHTLPCYQDLYRSVHFGNLPIPLRTITKLLQRQINAQHAERLSYINAPAIVQWEMSDMLAFCHAASSSLTTLILAARYTETGAQLHPSDLWEFVSLVKHHLPHLEHLHFALGDPSTVEDVCGPLLHRSLLDRRGPVKGLQVFTPSHTVVPFNLVRLLSYMCSTQSHISFGGPFMGQPTDYLSYLRNQSPARRRHLSTIDFPSIGVDTFQQVQDLSFHADGRPRTLGESHAQRWLADACIIEHANDHDILPEFDRGMQKLKEAIKGFRDGSITAGSSLMPVETLVLQAAVEGMKEAAIKAEKTTQAMKTVCDTINLFLRTGKGDRPRHWMKKSGPSSSAPVGRG